MVEYNLVADSGSYTYTGQSARLAQALAVSAGSYTYTGSSAVLKRSLFASGGSYSVAGPSVGFPELAVNIPVIARTMASTGTSPVNIGSGHWGVQVNCVVPWTAPYTAGDHATFRVISTPSHPDGAVEFGKRVGLKYRMAHIRGLQFAAGETITGQIIDSLPTDPRQPDWAAGDGTDMMNASGYPQLHFGGPESNTWSFPYSELIENTRGRRCYRFYGRIPNTITEQVERSGQGTRSILAQLWLYFVPKSAIVHYELLLIYSDQNRQDWDLDIRDLWISMPDTWQLHTYWAVERTGTLPAVSNGRIRQRLHWADKMIEAGGYAFHGVMRYTTRADVNEGATWTSITDHWVSALTRRSGWQGNFPVWDEPPGPAPTALEVNSATGKYKHSEHTWDTFPVSTDGYLARLNRARANPVSVLNNTRAAHLNAFVHAGNTGNGPTGLPTAVGPLVSLLFSLGAPLNSTQATPEQPEFLEPWYLWVLCEFGRNRHYRHVGPDEAARTDPNAPARNNQPINDGSMLQYGDWGMPPAVGRMWYYNEGLIGAPISGAERSHIFGKGPGDRFISSESRQTNRWDGMNQSHTGHNGIPTAYLFTGSWLWYEAMRSIAEACMFSRPLMPMEFPTLQGIFEWRGGRTEMTAVNCYFCEHNETHLARMRYHWGVRSGPGGQFDQHEAQSTFSNGLWIMGDTVFSGQNWLSFPYTDPWQHGLCTGWWNLYKHMLVGATKQRFLYILFDFTYAWLTYSWRYYATHPLAAIDSRYNVPQAQNTWWQIGYIRGDTSDGPMSMGKDPPPDSHHLDPVRYAGYRPTDATHRFVLEGNGVGGFDPNGRWLWNAGMIKIANLLAAEILGDTNASATRKTRASLMQTISRDLTTHTFAWYNSINGLHNNQYYTWDATQILIEKLDQYWTTQAPLGLPPAWWDTNYRFRRRLSCDQTHSAYAVGDILSINLTLVGITPSRPDYSDVRIVRRDANGFTDIGRVIERQPISGTRRLYFPIQDALAANANIGSNTAYEYYLYYGNPAPATQVPAYRNQVGLDGPFETRNTNQVFYWDQSGSLAHDGGPWNIPAIPVNCALLDGPFGGAALLDGQTSTFGRPVDFNFPDQIPTFEFWIFILQATLNAAVTPLTLMSLFDAQGNLSLYIRILPTGASGADQIRAEFNIGGNPVQIEIPAGGWTRGAWCHIAFDYDGAVLRAKADSVVRASRAAAGRVVWQPGQILAVGSRYRLGVFSEHTLCLLHGVRFSWARYEHRKVTTPTQTILGSEEALPSVKSLTLGGSGAVRDDSKTRNLGASGAVVTAPSVKTWSLFSGGAIQDTLELVLNASGAVQNTLELVAEASGAVSQSFTKTTGASGLVFMTGTDITLALPSRGVVATPRTSVQLASGTVALPTSQSVNASGVVVDPQGRSVDLYNTGVVAVTNASPTAASGLVVLLLTKTTSASGVVSLPTTQVLPSSGAVALVNTTSTGASGVTAVPLTSPVAASGAVQVLGMTKVANASGAVSIGLVTNPVAASGVVIVSTTKTLLASGAVAVVLTKTSDASGVVALPTTKLLGASGLAVEQRTQSVNASGAVQLSFVAQLVATGTILVPGVGFRTLFSSGAVQLSKTSAVGADGIIALSLTASTGASGVVQQAKTSTASASGAVFVAGVTKALMASGAVQDPKEGLALHASGVVQVSRTKVMSASGGVQDQKSKSVGASGLVEDPLLGMLSATDSPRLTARSRK